MPDIDLIVVISEVNLMGSNPKEWWIDTGATRHVFLDKKVLISIAHEDDFFSF